MAKVVVAKSRPIQFTDSNAFSIVNHEIISGKYYFDVEVKLDILEPNSVLKGNFEIQITRETPVVNRPNMFKNANIENVQDFNNLIKSYDVSRLKKFNRTITPIRKVSLIYQDFLRKGLSFTIEDQGTQILYASIVDVSNNLNNVIQVANIDFEKLVTDYALPRTDFVLGSSNVFKNKTRILITPKDKRIQKFKVYVQNSSGNKNISEKNQKPILAPVTNEGFASVDIFDSGDTRKIVKVVPTSFYRNLTNSAYQEIVLNKEKIHNEQCVIYPLQFTGNIANFAISNIPDNVNYIKLIRLSKTHREKTYRVIDSLQNSGNRVVLTDSFIAPYTTYSYKALFEFKDGTQHTSAATYVLHPKILESAVNVSAKLVSQTSNNDQITRKFSVNISYKDTTATQSLLNDLRGLGIDNIYPNEIKNLSTQLDPLIGVLVTRVDPILCVEEKVGIFKPGEIIDTFIGSSYCAYIFEVMIKSPTEIVEDIGTSRNFYIAGAGLTPGNPMISPSVLGSNNVNAKMNFTQKFFNKSALAYGTLRYGKSLPSDIAGIESGKTSIFATVESFPSMTTPKLQFIRKILRKDDKIVVWNASSLVDVSRIEIFDITKTSGGQPICRIIVDESQTEISTSVDMNVSKVRIACIMRNDDIVSIEANI